MKPKTEGDVKKSTKKSTKITEENEENDMIDNEAAIVDSSNLSSRKSSKDELLGTKPITKDERSNSTVEKSAMDVINEIFNPPLMEFDAKKPYHVPEAVNAGDVNALQDLDERKLIELKEVSIRKIMVFSFTFHLQYAKISLKILYWLIS